MASQILQWASVLRVYQLKTNIQHLDLNCAY